jgi:hypothetical protein
MSMATVQSWTDRVLAGRRLGTAPDEDWVVSAYERYRDKLRAPDYPCFFGQGGETRGEMLYTFIALDRAEELVTNMRQFVGLIATSEYKRSSLVAFFEPDRAMVDHSSFVKRFWGILQLLHERDSDPATDKPPEDPLWEFSFERHEMFVVGASPSASDQRMFCLPCCRCEFGDSLNGFVCDSGKDFSEVFAHRDFEPAAAFDHGEDCGYAGACLLAADVYPVRSAECDGPHRILREVVTELKRWMIEETDQPFPKGKCVSAGLAGSAPGQRRLTHFDDVGADLFEQCRSLLVAQSMACGMVHVFVSRLGIDRE